MELDSLMDKQTVWFQLCIQYFVYLMSLITILILFYETQRFWVSRRNLSIGWSVL